MQVDVIAGAPDACEANRFAAQGVDAGRVGDSQRVGSGFAESRHGNSLPIGRSLLAWQSVIAQQHSRARLGGRFVGVRTIEASSCAIVSVDAVEVQEALVVAQIGDHIVAIGILRVGVDVAVGARRQNRKGKHQYVENSSHGADNQMIKSFFSSFTITPSRM